MQNIATGSKYLALSLIVTQSCSASVHNAMGFLRTATKENKHPLDMSDKHPSDRLTCNSDSIRR